MKQTILFFILFCLFLLQGTVMQVHTPVWNGKVVPIVPHFAFIAILLIGLIFQRKTAIIYSLIFGLLTDIVYTDLIGVYLFTMTLATYLISSLSKVFHMNLLVVILLSLLGVGLVELQVYGIYLLINVASLPVNLFFQWRLPPVLILNGAFVILLFFPYRKFLINLEGENTED